jgi:hypothetical protein
LKSACTNSHCVGIALDATLMKVHCKCSILCWCLLCPTQYEIRDTLTSSERTTGTSVSEVHVIPACTPSSTSASSIRLIGAHVRPSSPIYSLRSELGLEALL